MRTEAQNQALTQTLEEASNLVTNRLIINTITSKGEITLEEATFFNSLSKEIIFEAMQDFIPDTEILPGLEVDVPENPESIQDEMILKDDEGNEYMFHPSTGTLEALSVKPEEVSNGAIGEPEAGIDISESEDIPEDIPEELSESVLLIRNLIK